MYRWKEVRGFVFMSWCGVSEWVGEKVIGC